MFALWLMYLRWEAKHSIVFFAFPSLRAWRRVFIIKGSLFALLGSSSSIRNLCIVAQFCG